MQYTVYKITNKINNKCYIGSSKNVKKRWQQHKYCAFHSDDSRYNYPLYQAFRKYGIENFSFEILKNDFNSEVEMQLYEKEMIHFYNSTTYGYNQTDKTLPSELIFENYIKSSESRKQPCAKVNINNEILEIYTSYHEAALKNGYDPEDCASLFRDACKGNISSVNGEYYRDLNEDGKIIKLPFKKWHSKKSIVGININNPLDRVYYESLNEASRQLNIDRRSLSKCLAGSTRYSNIKGYIWREIDLYGNIIEIPDLTIQTIINKYNEKNPIINGERHNISEWCKIYNISLSAYKNRRKKGMGVIEAITTPKKK